MTLIILQSRSEKTHLVIFLWQEDGCRMAFGIFLVWSILKVISHFTYILALNLNLISFCTLILYLNFVVGFSKAYNIRYCNKRQLLSLYEAMQKLQRTKYLNTLIQIILHDVIPTIKSNIESASVEYTQAYKTMFILYQGLNPEVPVLVKTDS